MDSVVLWRPDDLIPEELLDLDGWKWDENGVNVCLTNKHYRFVVHFEGQVLAFRTTLESMSLRFRDMYGEWRKRLHLNYAWTFFILKDSEYIKWFEEQHYGLYDDVQNKLIHYVLVTEDEIIEVLNDKEPIVTVEPI
ncbi:MAG: hypothetical protein ACM3MK_14395 [Chitinophagales bacterium]